MSKTLRYTGEFLSVAGVVWRVDILQESALPFGSVGELTFEADSPLVIEWAAKSKEEVICGSVATLKIESPGDRTYIDLYTVEAGGVLLEVYRDGELYWRGSLDPEFYEEPYERAARYPVTLTFSDFGVLDRLKWSMSGEPTVRDAVKAALGMAGLGGLPVDDETYVSSYLIDDGTGITDNKAHPGNIVVRADNFYDEEGEPMTMKEVVEGMLQPLALRITQRGGKVYVYDLNGLCQSAPTTPIEWTSDSQTLGTDKVLNNVKVTFSPYADSEVSGGALEYGGGYSSEVYNYHTSPLSEYGDTADAAALYDKFGEFYSFESAIIAVRSEKQQWGLLTNDRFKMFNAYPNFNIFLSGKGSGLAYVNPQWCRYFHIEPLLAGPPKADGVLAGLCTLRSEFGLRSCMDLDYTDVRAHRRYFLKDLSIGGTGRVILKTNKVYLPFIPSSNQHYIRLSLESLIDPRYNPFTSDADVNNETDSYNEYKSAAGWIFVPVAVNLYNAEGEAIWHYTNSNIAKTSAWGHLAYARGEWSLGEGGDGDAWLSYYDVNDPKGGNGILGWQTNRHCIGRADNACRKNMRYYPDGGKPGEISEMLKKIPAGEYIPYPPDGGWLEVVVYEGIRGFEYDEYMRGKPFGVPLANFDAPWKWARQRLLKKLRWYLLKAPKVEVVNVSSILSSAPTSTEDVEYSGWINPAAKDDLGIDTVCGSLPDAAISDMPTARGVLIDGRGYGQIRSLTRSGVTDHPENLLIGTLYSQYADRHMTLSGEAAIKPQGLCLFTDAAQPPDRKFLQISAVEDCRIDCGDSEFTELSPDEYTSINPLT